MKEFNDDTLKCRKHHCKNVIVRLQGMIDGVYKHVHPHLIFILHAKLELWAEKVRRVWKTQRSVAVPVMTSIGTIAHWFSIKRIQFGSQLRQNEAFVLNVT